VVARRDRGEDARKQNKLALLMGSNAIQSFYVKNYSVQQKELYHEESEGEEGRIWISFISLFTS
jgi:hypothetical protein